MYCNRKSKRIKRFIQRQEKEAIGVFANYSVIHSFKIVTEFLPGAVLGSENIMMRKIRYSLCFSDSYASMEEEETLIDEISFRSLHLLGTP